MSDVATRLERATLEDQVAQLLMPDASAKNPIEPQLAALPFGGFLVQRSLARKPAALAAAVRDAQARVANGIPLFIGADQEGGHVAFMREGATEVPSNMGLAATGSSASAAEAAGLLAAELGIVGVNWTFAPVTDVNVNPDNPVIGVRAYSDDPETVGAFAAAAIQGFQSGGVLACAKHFPGHGDTHLDSHIALPVVTSDRETLERVHIAPFRAAIGAGVASVMTAHIRVTALDPERVATLSAPILTGVLREGLAFDGLIVTDAMEMHGVASEWSPEDAAVETVRAGADVILPGSPLEKILRVHAALVRAVRGGTIPEPRFREALARIARVKASLVSTADPDRAERELAAPERVERALELARRSITLVRDDVGALPLPVDIGDRLVVLAPVGTKRTMMETWHAQPCALGEELAAFAPGLVDVQLEYPLSSQERARALKATERAEVVVVGTLNAALDPEQVSLIEDLAERSSAHVVVVSLRAPYDLRRLPWVRTFLAAYTTARPALRATAEALVGRIPTSGRLPVTVTPTYRRGYAAASPLRRKPAPSE
ncbi:MAG TPA: glycoside hydrolase family 3 N-terminal domain-containing protein [Candidatus Dormibacteraeota bacterium]|nr:glycoside hydrolase family 3 N-terminal domain-containing protein [Candidatus Dormibacteraeota bacterium]